MDVSYSDSLIARAFAVPGPLSILAILFFFLASFGCIIMPFIVLF